MSALQASSGRSRRCGDFCSRAEAVFSDDESVDLSCRTAAWIAGARAMHALGLDTACFSQLGRAVQPRAAGPCANLRRHLQPSVQAPSLPRCMVVGARVFGSNRFDRYRELFANRFEPQGDGFVYRSSATAAPVKVSRAERDAFVAQFNRRLSWLYWGMLALMVAGVGAYVWATIVFDLPVSSIPLYVGIGALMVAYLLGWRMVWAAPQRALAGRNPAGPGRTREEARRAALAKMTWAQIGGGALLLAGGMLRIGWTEDLFHGWNRLWLVLFALAGAAVGVAAFRKWRFDREAGARPRPGLTGAREP